ncbi:hypothetical protein QAD02_001446 [Eretmocerus hayati]|uniref:Uncharacterized protein n=1 Tax=Eretmocerus hayati TaxID=131215 RepID=A0ACC2NGI1_9HYME|nr:hypothetical protein QAD02_001446 [Eretmocerus hayati]
MSTSGGEDNRSRLVYEVLDEESRGTVRIGKHNHVRSTVKSREMTFLRHESVYRALRALVILLVFDGIEESYDDRVNDYHPVSLESVVLEKSSMSAATMCRWVDSVLGDGASKLFSDPLTRVYREYTDEWKLYPYGHAFVLPSREDYVLLKRLNTRVLPSRVIERSTSVERRLLMWEDKKK